MLQRLLFCLIFALFLRCAYAEKYALVIGIRYDKLPGQEIPECVNDASAMEKLLQGQYGMKDSNIQVILAEKATKANLVQALDDLVKKVREKDQVILYYSGHGLQVDDDNADEEDEKDEAILAYDNEYIRDDDIGNYIQKMSKRGVDIVFIMDSCYSGTGMKSFNINANPAKPYFRPKYCYKPEWLQRYQTRQDRLSVQQKSTRSMQIVKRIIENNESEKPTAGEDIFMEAEESTGKVVFFSGCSENEVSWTMGSKGHSAFTYHLLNAYKNNLQGDANRDGIMTFEEAFQFVRQNVSQESFPTKQNPTMEGQPAKNRNHLYPGLFWGERVYLPAPQARKVDIKEFLTKLVMKQNFTPAYSDWNLQMKLEPEKSSFRVGEYVKVHVQTNASGYLFLLNLTERGAVTLLYPNAESPKCEVKAGETISIPPKGAAWGIQVQPPKGREWMIAYIFEKNPLAGYDLPDTFVKDFMLDSNVEQIHSAMLGKEDLQSILSTLGSSKANIVRIQVIEKWNKCSVQYEVK